MPTQAVRPDRVPALSDDDACVSATHLETESFNEDVQAEEIRVKGRNAVLVQMLIFANRAGNHGVLKFPHQGVELDVELSPMRRVGQLLEAVSVPADVRRVQQDIRFPEHVSLEGIQGSRQGSFGIVPVDDDPAEHEERVLRVDFRQVVVTRLVEEQNLQLPLLVAGIRCP